MGFIKKNWLGLLGLVVGLVGIFLSYYFYTLSQQNREPYFVEESNFPIFFSQKELASQGFVLVRKYDGREITKKVYVNELAIWNKGSLSIKRNNILKNISLKYPKSIEVIDAFVSSVTRKDIVRPEKPVIKNTNEVALGFEILEKNDGFKIQIIYLSDFALSPEVVGDIEGVKVFGTEEALVNENIIFGIGKVLIICLIVISLFLILFGLIAVTEKLDRLINVRLGSEKNILQSLLPGLYILIVVVIGIFALIDSAKNFAKEEARASVPVMETVLEKPNRPIE